MSIRKWFKRGYWARDVTVAADGEKPADQVQDELTTSVDRTLGLIPGEPDEGPSPGEPR